MNDLYDMLKNLLFLIWCGYVTVMCIIGAFQAEEALDVMVAFFVWAFIVGISASIYEVRQMRIKEDIQTMWERGISVHVIAKKYSCEPIDIMRMLGILE